jgi:hypothetical protein
MHFRYYILGLLATFAFSLQLNNKPDSSDLSNGRSLEDMDLEDGWEDSEEMSVTPLLKRQVVGGMGLYTACWKAGRTYTVTPIAGVVISTFLQPGGSDVLGYTVSWAAENALNVAVSIILTFILPNNGGPSTVRMMVQPGVITPTSNWNFPAGSTNFQVAAGYL